MIILNTTTDSLEVVLAGAITTNQLQCFSSYRDITTTTFAPGRQAALTASTTPATLVSPPAASTQRIIDYVSVYNNDTVNATVTISFNDNGTRYTEFRATILTGEKIEYVEGDGFKVIASNGAVKLSYAAGNNPTGSSINTVVLASDVTNNNAVANTIQDITGLSFAVTANKTYWFRFVIDYTAALAATGSRFSINGPAITRLSYYSNYSLTLTTQTVNHGLNAYDLPAASNATSAAVLGNIAIVEGFLTPSASGTLIARFASEVSSSAIVAKAGSICQWQEVL